MREILFRGKTNAGRWVYGSLIKDDNTYEIFNDKAATSYIVQLHTIGQYTGLKDKHRNKIFEGDIVEYHDFTSVYAEKYVGNVIYYYDRFLINVNKDFSKRVSLEQDDFSDRKRTVLGNIHDNPELLD